MCYTGRAGRNTECLTAQCYICCLVCVVFLCVSASGGLPPVTEYTGRVGRNGASSCQPALGGGGGNDSRLRETPRGKGLICSLCHRDRTPTYVHQTYRACSCVTRYTV
ncbi:hypothetical protein FKM82_011748 [Ascaphus truei]